MLTARFSWTSFKTRKCSSFRICEIVITGPNLKVAKNKRPFTLAWINFTAIVCKQYFFSVNDVNFRDLFGNYWWYSPIFWYEKLKNLLVFMKFEIEKLKLLCSCNNMKRFFGRRCEQWSEKDTLDVKPVRNAKGPSTYYVILLKVFHVKRVTFFLVNRVEHQKLNQTTAELPFGWVFCVQLGLRQTQ